MRCRLLLNEGQDFHFAHPLIRHLFYAVPLVPRRQRIHAQIAETLERLYGSGVDSHVLEIAHHLVNAGPAAKAEKVLEYARRAGDYAFSVFAWGEASRYYEAALSTAAAASTLSARERAELHYWSGLAHYRDMDIGPCLDHCEKALVAYREIADLPGLAWASMTKTRAYLTQAAVPYGALADVQTPQEVLSALGEREPALRGRLAAIIAEALWHARQTEEAEQMARQALAVGRMNQDALVCAYSSHVLALTYMQSLRPQEALASWQDALAFAREADDLWLQTWPMTRMPWVLTALGRLEEAEQMAISACALTRKLQNWAEYSMAIATLAVLRVIKGDFAAAEQDLREVMLMVRRSHYPWGGARSLPALACAHWWRGEWDDAEEALNTLLEPGRVFTEAGPSLQAGVRMYRQLLRSYRGVEEKEKIQALLNPPRATGKDRFDIGALPGLCAFAEIVSLAKASTNTEPLYQTLALAKERGVVFSTEWVFLLPRILGVVAALNCRWEAAEEHFLTAITTASQIGARPELGRVCLDYARMLVTWDESRHRDRAVALLQQASFIFVEFDMQPFSRQTVQLAEILQIELPQSPWSLPHDRRTEATSGIFRVIFFSDMVGSTDILRRLGDLKAQEVTRAHNAMVRACLRRHGGVEHQHTGDGFMASFASASAAITCVLEIFRVLANYNQLHAETPIQVRMGLNAGKALPEEGRLFGAAVNAAARICAKARRGEILVSESVRQLAASKGFTFVDRGLFELKGFEEPFRLYMVQGEDGETKEKV